MKSQIVTIFVSTMFLSFSSIASAGDEQNAPAEAREVLSQLGEIAPAVADFLDNAYAYAVYPHVTKVGVLLVGGAGGHGVVYQRGHVVGTSKLEAATFGPQIGGQSYSEFVAFENEATFQEFQKGELKLTAQVSSVAVTAGASANASYHDGVIVFTMLPKGLMAEVTVAGQVLSFFPVSK